MLIRLPAGLSGRSWGTVLLALGIILMFGINVVLIYGSHAPGAPPTIKTDDKTVVVKEPSEAPKVVYENPNISFNILALDPSPDTSIPIKGRNVITSAIFTSSYTGFALMLAYSIQKYNDIANYNAEMVLMAIRKSKESPKGITDRDAALLEKAGWKIREVKPLHWDNVDQTKIKPIHRYNLNKLQIWNWTDYDRIVFIDADCVIKSEFSDLFRVPGPLAAASDILGNDFITDSFNSGVMSLRPSQEVFQDYIKKVPTMHKPDEGDQPFLQKYWTLRYWQLPRKYNFNLAMWKNHREIWDKLWPEASIVHFAAWKPSVGLCKEGCVYKEPMQWFTVQFKEMLAAYGLEGELEVMG